MRNFLPVLTVLFLSSSLSATEGVVQRVTRGPDGDLVLRVGTDGDWYMVRLPEKIGYVYSGYMTLSDTGGEVGGGDLGLPRAQLRVGVGDQFLDRGEVALQLVLHGERVVASQTCDVGAGLRDLKVHV